MKPDLQASWSEPGYFFISGAHRSGTTWFMKMLNVHPEVSVRGEASFIGSPLSVDSWLNEDNILAWRKAGPRAKSWFRGAPFEDTLRDMKRGMIEYLMKKVLWSPGILMIGDKSPLFYCTAPEQVHELFPDAKFYCLIRDGRDVAVSHMIYVLMLGLFQFLPEGEDLSEIERRKAFYIEGEGDHVPLFTEGTLRNFANKWVRSIEGGRKAKELFKNEYREIRYEEMVESPKAVLKGVLNHLGVSIHDAILQDCVDGQSFITQSGRNPGQEDRSSYYRKGVVRDWVKYFTQDDIALYNSIAGDWLNELGYERT